MRGLDVRAGTVRQARREAGLTLAQVAGGELTRAAIHLIEVGKSRPSRRTLELIARRTGKDLSYFLRDAARPVPSASTAKGDVDVAGLERLALAGEHAQLQEQCERLLRRAGGVWSQAQLHYFLGRAHVELVHPEPAREHLQEARALFETVGDRWMSVECLDWEAGALYIEERPEALTIAQRALEACRQLDPVPLSTESRILGHVASIHVSRHEWSAAVTAYEEALRAAGAIRDLSRMARMYSALSLVYQELGNLGAASQYSHKALALHGMQRDEESIALAENNLALVLMRQGQLDAAEVHLKRSLAIFDELHLERGRAHVLLSLGELHLERRSDDEAARFVQQAIEVAERLQEEMTIAEGRQLLGRLWAAQGLHADSAREFENALSLLKRLGVRERLIECYTRYAAVLEAHGQTGRALDCLKEAMALARPQLSLRAREPGPIMASTTS